MPEKNEQPHLGELIEELQQTVEGLSQEVQVLRNVLDEIREDFSWALRNGHSESIEETVADNGIDPDSESTAKYVEQDESDELEEIPVEEPVSSLLANNTEARIKKHEEWVRTVRDPAQQNSEGLRRLQALNGKATAEYEVAPLSDGRWAIQITLSYHCGDMQGTTIPWSEYDSRDACIDQFESRAKQFFQKPIDNGGNEAQQIARKEMLKHFEGSLFGFVEPDFIQEVRDANENIGEEILQPLKYRILEYLSANIGSVKLSDIRNDMGFSESDSADPLADPVNRALVALQNTGNVSVIESDFGEPSFLFQHRLYLRPDRQTNFDGLPFYEWPEPEEDRDSLTVDRVGNNGDGDAHRFTVKRGDTVGVFFSRKKQEIGTVVGISHANREVRVAFRVVTNGQRSEGTWFAIGSIYPALEPALDEDGAPLSKVVEQVNQTNTPQEQEFIDAGHVTSSSPDAPTFALRDSPGKDVESLTKQHRPYQFDDFQQFLQRLDSGEITAADLQADFSRLIASREALIAQLIAEKNAKTLQVLASRFGCLDARRNTKQQNAESVLQSMSLAYTLKNSVMYQPFSGETYEEAIQTVVESIGDAEIEEYVQQRNAHTDKVEKSLNNPETREEFSYFVDRRGETQLSHQQLVQYDRLRADQSRKDRADQRPVTVEQFSGDVAGLKITIKEGFHTRQNIPLWICQLNARVERATFSDLKFKAQQLGGWWSSFKKADAGFQFKNEDSAKKFQSLLEGDADRSDELTDRKTRKIETASERLSQLADDLEQSANENLSQDRLTNTVRRSEMAAGIRGRAYVDLAFAGTLRSLAAAFAAGEATYLDGIRTKTQLATLIHVLRRGKRKRNDRLLNERGDLGIWERHNAVEDLDSRPIETEDTDFVEYPYPNLYKRNLEEIIVRATNRKGVKLRAQKMQKRISGAGDFIQFKEEQEIETFTDFCSRCKEVGLDVHWLERSLDEFKRLRAANIHTLPELRMALRELVPHLQKRKEDDPVLKAEQALVGRKLEGFFPTPKLIISRMLELAEIQPGERVLEPSAGKGDILDQLRLHHPDAEVTAIELNGTLFDILEAKGHSVGRGDFLEHQAEYDRIVMNPPFEKGADIEHVRHAFDQLAPHGTLVAIMSEGPFFRSDNQATEFRDWLNEVDGESEPLPEDAFNSSEAFRKTEVRTRIVTIKNTHTGEND